MEEIDLCWRFRSMGYRVMYCGGSMVYHVGGGTLHKVHPRKTFLNFRNGILLLYKNLPSGQLWITLFVRLVLDGVAAFQLLFSAGPAHFGAVLRAHFDFYGRFGLWTNKGQACPTYKRWLKRDAALPGSIVWHYYVLRKRYFRDLPAQKFQTVG
jgi:hypothetical protein